LQPLGQVGDIDLERVCDGGCGGEGRIDQPPLAGDVLAVTATFTFTCPLGCASQTETVSWVAPDGTEHTQTHAPLTGNCTATTTCPSTTDVWTALIPADDVRFPTVKYRFTASESTTTGLVSAYSPTPTGSYYSVTANDVVRLGFQNANGTPAANLPVKIYGANVAGPVTQATTDANGRMSYTVDPTSSFVQSAITSGEKQTSLTFWASTVAPPTTAPAAGQPVTVSGVGEVVVVQLNLGRAAIPAADSRVQDQTFPVHAVSEVFTNAPASSSSQSCIPEYTSQVCTWTDNLGGHETPVANNLGGGVDVSGFYLYTNNDRTTTSHGVSAGAGWASTKGETTASTTTEASATSTTYGPSDARQFEVMLNYEAARRSVCYYHQDGTVQACETFSEAYPKSWGGGIVDPSHASANSLFDRANSPTNACGDDDYTVGMGQQFTSSVVSSKGVDLDYMLNISAYEFVTIQASTTHSSSTTNSVKVTFNRTANSRTYHFVFVQHGAKTGQWPSTAPDITYTTASNSDLTNTAVTPNGCAIGH
jgi:hypothetical protein